MVKVAALVSVLNNLCYLAEIEMGCVIGNAVAHRAVGLFRHRRTLSRFANDSRKKKIGSPRPPYNILSTGERALQSLHDR